MSSGIWTNNPEARTMQEKSSEPDVRWHKSDAVCELKAHISDFGYPHSQSTIRMRKEILMIRET